VASVTFYTSVAVWLSTARTCQHMSLPHADQRHLPLSLAHTQTSEEIAQYSLPDSLTDLERCSALLHKPSALQRNAGISMLPELFRCARSSATGSNQRQTHGKGANGTNGHTNGLTTTALWSLVQVWYFDLV